MKDEYNFIPKCAKLSFSLALPLSLASRIMDAHYKTIANGWWLCVCVCVCTGLWNCMFACIFPPWKACYGGGGFSPIQNGHYNITISFAHFKVIVQWHPSGGVVWCENRKEKLWPYWSYWNGWCSVLDVHIFTVPSIWQSVLFRSR